MFPLLKELLNSKPNGRKITALILFAIQGVIFFTPAAAASSRWDAPELGSRSAVVMDAATGTIIFYKNPDLVIPPASLTKLMTMHLVFQEVAAGRASFDEIIPIGIESWAQSQPRGSSLMFLAPGQRVSLHEIMLGLAIPSGNDAAVAAALRFAPSIPHFAEMMTLEARRMGLEVTTFVEPSGISEFNLTTAREFAEFSRIYLQLYPESLSEFHSIREFAFPTAENVAAAFRERPNTIVQGNRNTLLRTFPGVDGLKTGFILQSGFNIALTAERDETRFIAVILGAPSGRGGDRIRDEDGRRLLEWAFDNYKTIRPTVNRPEPVRVWKGRHNYAGITWGAPLDFTSPVNRGENLSWHIELDEPIVAPLPAGSPVGRLVFHDNLGELRQIPLVTSRELERGGFFKRLFDNIRLFFLRLVT